MTLHHFLNPAYGFSACAVQRHFALRVAWVALVVVICL